MQRPSLKTTSSWMLHTKKADFTAIGRKNNIDPVLARIITNRGVSSEKIDDYLHPSKKSFNDPHLLKDAALASDIICEGIKKSSHIRIIGDYDIDGVCATHILNQCLLHLKARVDYYLPKRIDDGYGMTESMVRKAFDDGVQILLTCDNGISALPAIELAKKLGITVVVTDHHDIPKENSVDKLVPADAIIDPKRSDCSYPFPDICGAVVAWKLCFLLFEKMGVDDEFVSELIEFAAFATIGDIMKLVDENRAIVSLGLKKMSHTKNIGLAMLIEACGLNGKTINAYHVGFVLGPCLNAGGRLSDATMGVELFECKDRKEATKRAEELKSLNDERKEMTHKGTQAAIEAIEKNGYDEQNVLVVYLADIHESLCGIISGRLKEKYYKPSFMLTDSGELVKGSGRSIEGYSMTDKISQCSDILELFGGHPMAAGLSIKKENIEIFRKRLNDNNGLTDEQLIRKTMIDVPMPLSYIRKDLIEQLEILEPFGNGNEKPLFATKGVSIWRLNRIGKNLEYLRLQLKENDTVIDALYFGDADLFESNLRVGDAIDIIYYPQINEFRGNITLQIEIKDYRKNE